MPKFLKFFSDKKKALKYRNHQRLLNYKTGRKYQITQCRWEKWELEFLFSSHKCDRDIAAQLGRSVQAIQMKRFKQQKFGGGR